MRKLLLLSVPSGIAFFVIGENGLLCYCVRIEAEMAKTTKTTMNARIEKYLNENCSEVDASKLYDETLDEIYSFISVGGPFAFMQPSRVLSEIDPVAYRCGLSDWIDYEMGEGRFVEDDKGNLFSYDDYEEAVEAVKADIEAEIEGLEDGNDEDKEKALASLHAELEEIDKES